MSWTSFLRKFAIASPIVIMWIRSNVSDFWSVVIDLGWSHFFTISTFIADSYRYRCLLTSEPPWLESAKVNVIFFSCHPNHLGQLMQSYKSHLCVFLGAIGSPTMRTTMMKLLQVTQLVQNEIDDWASVLECIICSRFTTVTSSLWYCSNLAP